MLKLAPPPSNEQLDLLGQQVEKLLRGGARRGWVLTGDQQAVGDDCTPQSPVVEKWAPFALSSSSTRKGTTRVSPTASSSVLVKPVTFLPLHQGPSLRRLYVAQRARCVTNEGDGLVGGQESLNQLDRVLVLGQVPHWAMTAGIEDGVEILWLDAVEADRRGKLRLCCGIGLEPMREVVWKFGSLLFGSSGGWLPFGEASTISASAP
jgi:hypothetical protein